MHSTSRVLVCLVQLCFKNKDWNALNEHIVILTKRRSQLKQVEILQYLICSPKFYTVFLLTKGEGDILIKCLRE